MWTDTVDLSQEPGEWWVWLMRDGMVEIRESYFKRADGTVHMRRYVDNDLVWEGPSSLVFIDFSVADAP